jgi:hypothetical protein
MLQTYASHYIQATPLIPLSAQTCILPILILQEIGNREKIGGFTFTADDELGWTAGEEAPTAVIVAGRGSCRMRPGEPTALVGATELRCGHSDVGDVGIVTAPRGSTATPCPHRLPRSPLPHADRQIKPLRNTGGQFGARDPRRFGGG